VSVNAEDQARYWSRPGVRRAPDHPAVAGFARPKIKSLVEILALPSGPPPTLLEVGAGNGYFSLPLAEHFELTCLDLSEAMLNQNPVSAARKMRGDAQQLPIANGSFDFVFCGNLLHHLPDPALAVREMRRVARQAVLIVEPNALNPLMFAFSAIKRAERGALKFRSSYVKRLGRDAGLKLRRFVTQGSIVPNATPERWVPFLQRLDFAQPFGFYHIAVFDV
jgi:SAM-dependent methyltransferase